MSTDTIAAISTGGTNSGINIIRISGENSEEIISKIFTSYKKLDHQRIIYGKIIDPENLEVVDEVLVSCFKAPNSFTGENVYEINTHGGRRVTLDVLELVLKYGARIAEPGEFSKRAFLNGKMDLSKAEAIIDVINAKTKAQKKIAMAQLEGELEKNIKEIRNSLVELMAQIEVNIDYPEYDYDELGKNALKSILERNKDKIDSLIKTRDEGKYLKEGIDLAIIGGTNAGKSSLLNALAKEDRAIVTDIEGTTRDVIEESIVIGNMLVNISDTAGLRDTDDVVEAIGIKKSIEIIDKTDLVIYMIDSTKGCAESDALKICEIQKKNIPLIICLNKIDLVNVKQTYPECVKNNTNTVEISAVTGEGLDALKGMIEEMFNVRSFDKKQDKLVVNQRHKMYLENAKKSLNDAIKSVDDDESIDISAILITEAINALGSVTGESTSEDVVNKIFEKFCLGK